MRRPVLQLAALLLVCGQETFKLSELRCTAPAPPTMFTDYVIIKVSVSPSVYDVRAYYEEGTLPNATCGFVYSEGATFFRFYRNSGGSVLTAVDGRNNVCFLLSSGFTNVTIHLTSAPQVAEPVFQLGALFMRGSKSVTDVDHLEDMLEKVEHTPGVVETRVGYEIDCTAGLHCSSFLTKPGEIVKTQHFRECLLHKDQTCTLLGDQIQAYDRPVLWFEADFVVFQRAWRGEDYFRLAVLDRHTNACYYVPDERQKHTFRLPTRLLRMPTTTPPPTTSTTAAAALADLHHLWPAFCLHYVRSGVCIAVTATFLLLLLCLLVLSALAVWLFVRRRKKNRTTTTAEPAEAEIPDETVVQDALKPAQVRPADGRQLENGRWRYASVADEIVAIIETFITADMMRSVDRLAAAVRVAALRDQFRAKFGNQARAFDKGTVLVFRKFFPNLDLKDYKPDFMVRLSHCFQGPVVRPFERTDVPDISFSPNFGTDATSCEILASAWMLVSPTIFLDWHANITEICGNLEQSFQRFDSMFLINGTRVNMQVTIDTLILRQAPADPNANDEEHSSDEDEAHVTRIRNERPFVREISHFNHGQRDRLQTEARQKKEEDADHDSLGGSSSTSKAANMSEESPYFPAPSVSRGRLHDDYSISWKSALSNTQYEESSKKGKKEKRNAGGEETEALKAQDFSCPACVVKHPGELELKSTRAEGPLVRVNDAADPMRYALILLKLALNQRRNDRLLIFGEHDLEAGFPLIVLMKVLNGSVIGSLDEEALAMADMYPKLLMHKDDLYKLAADIIIVWLAASKEAYFNKTGQRYALENDAAIPTMAELHQRFHPEDGKILDSETARGSSLKMSSKTNEKKKGTILEGDKMFKDLIDKNVKRESEKKKKQSEKLKKESEKRKKESEKKKKEMSSKKNKKESAKNTKESEKNKKPNKQKEPEKDPFASEAKPAGQTKETEPVFKETSSKKKMSGKMNKLKDSSKKVNSSKKQPKPNYNKLKKV